MKFIVEIPVRVYKSNGKGIERATYMKIEVDQENEVRAAQVVAGRIQALLNSELA